MKMRPNVQIKILPCAASAWFLFAVIFFYTFDQTLNLKTWEHYFLSLSQPLLFFWLDYLARGCYA